MRKLVFVLPLFVVACSGGTSGPKGGDAVGMAVIDSDYKSTSVSLVDPKSGTLKQDDCIDSGAVSPVLSMALSGDVVLPSRAQAGDEVTLIDRTNSAIVWITPSTCTPSRQLSVSTGFSADPQDIVSLSAEKAYVPRYATNAKPGMVANDGGADVLIVDPSTPSVSGRIDLSSYGTSSAVVVHPTRGILANGSVYVALDEISADFMTTGPSRIVIIDPSTDKVTGTIDIATLLNCDGLDYVDSNKTLLVACGGDFNQTTAGQTAGSGVLVYDVSGATPTLVKTIPASGYPFLASSFAAIGETSALIATGGDSVAMPNVPASLFALDLTATTATKLADAGGAFVYGGFVADFSTHQAFVPDAETTTPVVSVYDVANAKAITAASSFAPDPKNGLPPRQIAWY